MPHYMHVTAGSILEVNPGIELGLNATSNVTGFWIHVKTDENTKARKGLVMKALTSSGQNLYIYYSYQNPLVNQYDYHDMSDYKNAYNEAKVVAPVDKEDYVYFYVRAMTIG